MSLIYARMACALLGSSRAFAKDPPSNNSGNPSKPSDEKMASVEPSLSG